MLLRILAAQYIWKRALKHNTANRNRSNATNSPTGNSGSVSTLAKVEYPISKKELVLCKEMMQFMSNGIYLKASNKYWY